MTDDIKTIVKEPVTSVKSVGEARVRHFHKLGIYTVEDLITYFPRDYEDRSKVKKIAALVDGETCAFEGIVMSKVSESRPRRGLIVSKVYLGDDTSKMIAVWYNQPYIRKIFKPGEKYILYGRVSMQFRSFEVQNPIYEKVLEEGQEMKNTLKIVPVYPLTANLTQNVIRTAICNALRKVAGQMEEILPLWMRNQYHLSEINCSMQNIHFPKSFEDFSNARFRLVFEELFLLQLGLLSIKSSMEEGKKGIPFRPVKEVQAFIAGLPFKLTCDQMTVFEEIEQDMESQRIMNRLIQGDVGSGKTIVAVLALFKAVKNGYQGALMVPTEILAEQHYHSISGLLDSYGMNVALLVGGQSKKQKAELLEGIEQGRFDVIIGTHALIEENVRFNKLGLVITDEQHRFGVRQRAVLSQKGLNPDVLVMTATPIPRTLALILYGDLDISLIKELPPGRKPIETYVVDNGMRERINHFIRKNVTEGRQAYIVCPLVEESDTIEAKSASELAERIAGNDFKDLCVGLLHGKMKSKEKDLIMKRFVDGEINILVSTTVIEVGVNVPNATLMVIENAERFGMAQLHQLRGRVGRGNAQSYCILYNEGKNEIARERMNIMKKTSDGFVISEKDLELRGPGEFFGTRQHGIPDLKIANLYKDIGILKMAQDAAFKVISLDRMLLEEENLKLKETIKVKFKEKLDHISLN